MIAWEDITHYGTLVLQQDVEALSLSSWLEARWDWIQSVSLLPTAFEVKAHPHGSLSAVWNRTDCRNPGDLCPICLIAGALETDLKDTGTGATETLLGPQAAVALKVVKLGMNTSEVLARFNNERHALAMMDHSNVACIFDAGATPRGRPYFVMEYIDGVSITEYCDRHRLTTKERLELFLPVCRAVQHEHEKGVIHRDTNVLVTGTGRGTEGNRFRHRESDRQAGVREYAVHKVRPDGGDAGVRKSGAGRCAGRGRRCDLRCLFTRRVAL